MSAREPWFDARPLDPDASDGWEQSREFEMCPCGTPTECIPGSPGCVIDAEQNQNRQEAQNG